MRTPLESRMFLVTAARKTQRHKGLVEGSLLVVERDPAVPRRRAEDVIRHLDIGVAQIFGCLRPVTDLRRIAANIEAREEGIELHGGLQAIGDAGSAHL
jgi:hypothetical protein